MLLVGAVSIGCVPKRLAGADSQPVQKSPGDSVIVHSNAVILVGLDEPLPIVQAVRDLAGDFEKVLGRKPRVINREEGAAPVTIWIGEKSKLPEALRPQGLEEPESFSISVARSEEKPQPGKVVLLAGADIRGAG